MSRNTDGIGFGCLIQREALKKNEIVEQIDVKNHKERFYLPIALL